MSCDKLVLSQKLHEMGYASPEHFEPPDADAVQIENDNEFERLTFGQARMTEDGTRHFPIPSRLNRQPMQLVETMNDWHFAMLNDTGRNAWFFGEMAAIEEIEKKRVLDVGAGSGILSMFAAKLGAKEIVAVEANMNLCRLFFENCKKNNIFCTCELKSGERLEFLPINSHSKYTAGARIRIIHDMSTNLKPENVGYFDVIVSETLGALLNSEGTLGFLRDAYVRLGNFSRLFPDQKSAIMIPSGGRQCITLIESEKTVKACHTVPTKYMLFPSKYFTNENPLVSALPGHKKEAIQNLDLSTMDTLADTASMCFSKQLGFRLACQSDIRELSERVCLFELDFSKHIDAYKGLAGVSWNSVDKTTISNDLLTQDDRFEMPKIQFNDSNIEIVVNSAHITGNNTSSTSSSSSPKNNDANKSSDGRGVGENGTSNTGTTPKNAGFEIPSLVREQYKIPIKEAGTIHAAVLSWEVYGPSYLTNKDESKLLTTHLESVRDSEWGFARDMHWGQGIQVLEDYSISKRHIVKNAPQFAFVKEGDEMAVELYASRALLDLQIKLRGKGTEMFAPPSRAEVDRMNCTNSNASTSSKNYPTRIPPPSQPPPKPTAGGNSSWKGSGSSANGGTSSTSTKNYMSGTPYATLNRTFSGEKNESSHKRTRERNLSGAVSAIDPGNYYTRELTPDKGVGGHYNHHDDTHSAKSYNSALATLLRDKISNASRTGSAHSSHGTSPN